MRPRWPRRTFSRQGRGHAAIDVFDPEPPANDHALVNHPQVLVTPHLGASTEEAQISVAVEAARLLTDYFQNGQIRFSVNMPTLDRAELVELRLYIDLARRLGMLHAQMDRGTAKGATIRYRGEVAHKNTRLVTASFAAGWLEAALEGQVNLVNAEVLAKERGITLIEEKSTDPGDFATVIQTEVVTDQKSYVAAGTLFGKEFLRLVRLGPYRLDAHLDSTLLVFTHRDKPGLIGFIGTLFGRHNVNIAQMNVGREHPGGDAIGVVNLDATPPESALEEVRNHPDILSVSLIKLPEAGATPPWLGL